MTTRPPVATPKDLGPLDCRTPIVDSAGRPSPEFQRRWQLQRGNNDLIGTPANPTATASDTAVNGVAPTFMRSDAAPAVQKASATQFGLVKPDGTTLIAPNGVISIPSNVPLPGAPTTTTPATADNSTKIATTAMVQAAAAAAAAAVARVPANPTATASDTAVNGVAPTFMRSDAAPAVQKASATQFGLVKPDGATITSAGGGGGGPGIPYFPTAPVAPAAASFTSSVGTGGVATIANLPSLHGVIHTFVSANTLLGAMALLNGYTPPAAGTDFSVQAFVMMTPHITSQGFGICLTDSAGKILHWGMRNSDIGGSQWTNVTTVVTGFSVFTPVPGFGSGALFRMARVGTNFHFDFSVDGETWITYLSQSTTTFLGATLAGAGLFMFNGAVTPATISQTCFSFTHTP